MGIGEASPKPPWDLGLLSSTLNPALAPQPPTLPPNNEWWPPWGGCNVFGSMTSLGKWWGAMDEQWHRGACSVRATGSPRMLATPLCMPPQTCVAAPRNGREYVPRPNRPRGVRIWPQIVLVPYRSYGTWVPQPCNALGWGTIHQLRCTM